MFSKMVFTALRKTHRLLHQKCSSEASNLLSKSKTTSFLEWAGWKQPDVPLSTAQLIFFFGPKYNDNIGCPIEKYNYIFAHRNFFKSKKTILYMHGYSETPDFESIQIMVNVYAKRSDVNFILLNWSELSNGSYLFDALPNITRLGPYLAEILLDLFESAVDIGTFHVIGHSLGGHLAGIVGREVYKKSKGTKQIRRISGLDPAFPLFYSDPLNKKDAEFVDIIHTDPWIYGYPFSTGHADFWPNAGKFAQTGVPKRSIFNYLTEEDFASHQRSWRYWAESMSHEYFEKFDAVQAKNWSAFKAGKFKMACKTTNKIVMGANCPFGAVGDYFLQTNGRPPYARGKAGTVYVDPTKLPGNECR